MSEQKRPEICEYCALGDHDAYICARWRLSYAVNELKKAVPLLRRTAEKQMKCPYYYPAGLLKTGLVIMDEIGPWPPERKIWRSEKRPRGPEPEGRSRGRCWSWPM